jgi:cation/acetate symporter
MNAITVAMFVMILVVSLGITAWAARRTKTTSDFNALEGKRDGCCQTEGLTTAQNGFAPDLEGCRSNHHVICIT